MSQEKKQELSDTAKWIGVAITLIGVCISIGIFVQRVANAEDKQEALEARVEKLENVNSQVLDRLTRIETLLNTRLPK